tara:strand:+ start:1873 stop:2529 length:657 start_codon:yes stop_codon:yes gene_type:complete
VVEKTVKKNRSFIKEVCVQTCEEAVRAQDRGADRIELCRRLDLDGLTPERKVIEQTLKSLSIPVKVMIRPRGGNFVYGRNELATMEKEIDVCKSMGVREVVFGLLTSKGSVDVESSARLADRASPMIVTFHKAIDASNNVMNGLQQLKSITPISSILSSGAENTALYGSKKIREMIQRFGSRFNIIAAGSITEENFGTVYSSIGCKEYHGRKIVGELT